MNDEETRWARQHDWFLWRELQADGTYVVVCRPDVNDVGRQRFSDIQKLRDWAGY